MEEEKTFSEFQAKDGSNSQSDISEASSDLIEGTDGVVFPESDAPSEQKPSNEAESVQETKALECAQKTETETSLDSLKEINSKLEGIADVERRISSEVKEMHKLYHTEFAGRLKSMQDELEQYRKVDKGRVYDDILASLARIYGNNETLADEVEDLKVKKSIRYMLLDIEDLLDLYGMSKLRSSPGEKRNPRHCQILNRIFTDDPKKHDTVVKSYNSGFFIGNRTVIKEMVDIYFYEKRPKESVTDNNTTTEAIETLNEE